MPRPPDPALRRALRVPRPVQSVRSRGAGPSRFLGYLANVSETGAFVQCTNPRLVGTRLSLQLRLPGLEDPVLCDSVEIVWTRRFSTTTDGSPGMGMCFVNLGSETRTALRRFCATGGPQGSTRISRG